MRELKINVGTRLMAAQITSLITRGLRYKRASELTGIPISTLVRYVRGKTLPSPRVVVKIRKIYEQLGRQVLASHYVGKLLQLGEDYAQDIELLKFVAWDLAEYLLGRRCTAILSLDPYITPATSIVAYFYQLKHAIAAEKPNGGRYVLVTYGDPPATLFIPYQQLRGEIVTMACTRFRQDLLEEAIAKLAEKNIETAQIYAVFGPSKLIKHPSGYFVLSRHLIGGREP